MKHLSKALAFGLAAAAAFTACAAAATLALGSTKLSAGNATVTACTSSLAATRNVDNSGNVTQVNVAGIPTACSGETLSVTLVGAASAALGTGSGTVGSCGTSCSVTITSFGATVSAANVLAYSFGLAGA
jgi:hypothetical protein